MKIIPVKYKGYCQGVVHAISIALKTKEEYPNETITILGSLVHNKYVVNELIKEGINVIENTKKTRLELLDNINEGIVIFTAHGVSDKVVQKAKDKGLKIVDATCPDVKKTYTLIANNIDKHEIIYIGKENHPESEGIIESFEGIHFITSIDDVNKLPHLSNPLVTSQTTLSIKDIENITKAIKDRYQNVIIAQEICNATRLRQEAILELENVDALIVVGDKLSNNSKQLFNIAKSINIPNVYFIDSAKSLTKIMLENKNSIAITSGSSTPNSITNQVINTIKDYSQTNILNIPKEIDIKLL